MKAYAIKDPNGFMFISSIKSLEENCKNNFLSEDAISEDEDDYSEHTWEYLEGMGYRCVPVEITEIKK